MPKRVFIVHRWDGRPEKDWYPWLKRELEKREFEAYVPAMPDPDEPRIETWVPFLAKAVGRPDRNMYFVGHSVGCQTILRYLEAIEDEVGGAIFVAGWFSLTPAAMPTEEDRRIAKPWLETSVNFEKIRSKAQNFVAILSDDDPFVPEDNAKIFEEKLGAKVIVESGRGHFSDSDDAKELPVVLDELLKIAKAHAKTV